MKPVLLQSIYAYSGTAGKVYFNDGGSLIYNNLETVVSSEHENAWNTLDITINAELLDTDGSETLSSVTIDGLPSGVIISQAGVDDVTTDGGVLSVDVSSGADTVLTATYQGSLGSPAFSVTATESINGDA